MSVADAIYEASYVTKMY